MKKTGKQLWVVFFLFFLFTASCDKDQSPKQNELARVNDRVITLQEFDQEMEQLPIHQKTRMIYPEGRKEFLQRLIDQELLVQEARGKGLDKDKRILVKLDILKRALIIDALQEELFKEKDEVSDEEVEAYYRENKERFFLGERIRVRHIVVKTLPEARAIKLRLEQGEDFLELARIYSISPNRYKGGDLGYIEKGMVGKEFGQAAFALKRRGEISNIIKTSYGYNIIRLEDKKQPYQRMISEVREEIRNFLMAQKRKVLLTDHLEDLRKKAHIVINEELLNAEEGGT